MNYVVSKTTVVDEKPEAVEVPELRDVGILSTKKTEIIHGDDFSEDISKIRAMGGINPGFKRSLTSQIRKAQQSADGSAGTKQILEPEFANAYSAFDVVEPPFNLNYLTELYLVSPVHFAAVNAKVANIVGLGFKLVENATSKRNFESIADNEKKTKKVRQELNRHRDELFDSLDAMNEDDTLMETFIKVWRDYETTGNGYMEVSRKKDGTIAYIGHIHAQTLRIRKARDGFVQVSGFEVQFFSNFGSLNQENPIGNDTPNEVIHFKKYSPTSGYYGIPDILAARQAIAGNEFAARFNLDFFENKAIPKHVIILKGAKIGPEAQSKILSFFETGLKGQNHRSLFLPIPGGTKDNPVDISFETLEPGVQESSFANYRRANNSDILMVHRVPVTKISISEDASLAIAKDADKTFKEQVCAPEQRIFEKKFGRIIKELSSALEFKLTEMTLTDADTQSQIDDRMVKAGIWLPNEPRTRDGMPAIEGGNERVDLNAKDKIAQAQAEATTQRERDSVRSSGKTDSAGAARNPKGEGRSTP